MKDELKALRMVVLSGRQVDLVDLGGLGVFMYTDDMSYQYVDEAGKHRQPMQFATPAVVPERLPEDRYDDPQEPLAGVLLSHHWVHNIEFAYFDIGCQYGTSAMATARLIQASGRSNHVYAFDPGLAGQLAPYSILLNKLEERVTFERLAVSGATVPNIVFTELNLSHNNRIINRMPSSESLSYPVLCTSIDQYVRDHGVRANLVLKIDTQGAEPEVFEGLRDCLRDRIVTCITEFTPSAVENRVGPEQWLRRLAETFVVAQVREDIFVASSHKVRLIPPDSFAAFVTEVATSSAQWTDLLLIPKNLPSRDALIARIT